MDSRAPTDGREQIETRRPGRGKRWARRALGFAPLVGMFAGIAVLVFSYGAISPIERILIAWRHPVTMLVAVEAFYLALQTALWLRYQAAPPVQEAELPRLSVIIPAFNEGPMVERSIRSVADAEYPRDRLEIIVVDDGSRDDTLFHMRKLRRTYPELVRVLHFPGNQGKRAALRSGFLAASGDVVLTVDSDSEMSPDTLKRMVAPFANARVGAVAGRIRVLNRDTFIGRMLEVQFTLSFDFARAAQSAYGTVMVCPGALSAFRRAVIVPHLDTWMDQRFLGRPVGHGEDQALTNIVLRAGYDTVYQRDAAVWTLVPDRYRQLSKMLLRWDRSFLVEGFSFARFMFKRCRPRGRVLPVVALLCSNLRFALLFVALSQVPSLFAGEARQLSHVLAAAAVAALGSALYYLRTERSLRFLYGAVYALYSLLLLQWILPWAILTVRDERWGTR